MKKYLFSCILIFSLLFTGCKTPISQWFKASKSVETTKKEIVKTDDAIMKKVTEYLYGADFTLSLAPTNRYTEVAKNFTERGLVTGGYPSMAETLILQKIVKDLVSTNQEIVLRGEKALKVKDQEVIDLQVQNKELQEKLSKQEEKLATVNAENAKLANTWKKITTGFWWILWILGIGFVLNVICHALPPPWNNIAAIIGLPIGLLIKIIKGLVPSAISFGGVVSDTVHKQSQDTLEKLVLAIEEIRKNDPDTFKNIEPVLKDKTTPETRSKIIDIKKDYGMI